MRHPANRPRFWRCSALGFGLVCAAAAVAAPGSALAQAFAVADGPWTGQAQCVLTTTQGLDYRDEQTHTWLLTGDPPRVEGDFRVWPAVWTVTGQGSSGPPVGIPGTINVRDTWTATVPRTSAPISIWVAPNGKLRISSRHGLLVVRGALTASRGPQGGLRVPLPAGDIQEWRFPALEEPADRMNIAGSREGDVDARVGYVQKAGAKTREKCTWAFTRIGTAQTSNDTGRTRADTQGRPPREITPGPGDGGSNRESREGRPPLTGPTPPPAPNAGLPRAENAPPNALGAGRREELTPVVSAPCTLAGPNVKQKRATPGNASLTWDAVPNATGYTVARDDLGPITLDPIRSASFTHNAPLDYRVSYGYTVTALYQQGCGSTKVQITPERAGVPTVGRITASGGDIPTRKGRVTLEWTMSGSDATGFVVNGPGTGNGIEVPVESGDLGRVVYRVAIGSLDPGDHSWLVTPYWTRRRAARSMRATGPWRARRSVSTAS